MKNRRRRWKHAVACSVLAIYVLTCAYFWWTQDQKIFKPLEKLASNPGRLGMEYDEVKIPVGNGDQNLELDAFWVPAADEDAPAVLYLHGQDDNIGKNLFHTLHLHQSGFNVLVVDYRGFGDSYHKYEHLPIPSQDSVFEDAEAAWIYLTNDLRFEDENVFIYGHSLGAAIAIELATHYGDAGGLILESGFTSVKDMAHEKMWVTWCLPVEELLNHKFDSIGKIREIKMPILFIHGKDDEKVPYWMTERLHAAAREPKDLRLIEGGGHADCCLIDPVAHRKALQDLVSVSRDRSVEFSEN